MSVIDVEHSHLLSIELLNQQITAIKENVNKVEISVNNLTEVITKFAVIEEKNLSIIKSLEELRETIRELNDRLVTVEKEKVKIIALAQGISVTIKVIWAAFGALIVGAISVLVRIS